MLSFAAFRSEMPYCSLCNLEQAIYFRPYSGEYLCRKCFLASIGEKVRKTISRHKMFEHDSRIAIGVSGGKDSLSLLHIMAEIERDFSMAKLTAITVDEGIQNYRDEAIKLAEEATKTLGIEHLVVSFKELFGHSLDEIVEKTKNGPLTPCSFCGVLRRRALNTSAKMIGADRLATAHNLDDMAQTVLLNMLRGDHRRLLLLDPRGSPLSDMFVARVKPYCEIPERESTLHAYIRGIRFQSRPCPYAPASMRSDIRDFLDRMEVKRPGTKFIVFQSMQKMLPQLEQENRVFGTCKRCGEPTTQDLCRACSILEDLS